MFALLCNPPQIDDPFNIQASSSRLVKKRRRASLPPTDVALKRGDSSSSRASSKLSKKDIGPPTAFRHQFHIGPDVVNFTNSGEPWDEERWKQVIEMRLRDPSPGSIKSEVNVTPTHSHTASKTPSSHLPLPATSHQASTPLSVPTSPENPSTASMCSYSTPPSPSPTPMSKAQKRASLVRRKPVPALYPEEGLQTGATSNATSGVVVASSYASSSSHGLSNLGSLAGSGSATGVHLLPTILPSPVSPVVGAEGESALPDGTASGSVPSPKLNGHENGNGKRNGDRMAVGHRSEGNLANASSVSAATATVVDSDTEEGESSSASSSLSVGSSGANSPRPSFSSSLCSDPPPITPPSISATLGPVVGCETVESVSASAGTADVGEESRLGEGLCEGNTSRRVVVDDVAIGLKKGDHATLTLASVSQSQSKSQSQRHSLGRHATKKPERKPVPALDSVLASTSTSDSADVKPTRSSVESTHTIIVTADSPTKRTSAELAELKSTLTRSTSIPARRVSICPIVAAVKPPVPPRRRRPESFGIGLGVGGVTVTRAASLSAAMSGKDEEEVPPPPPLPTSLVTGTGTTSVTSTPVVSPSKPKLRRVSISINERDKDKDNKDSSTSPIVVSSL